MFKDIIAWPRIVIGSLQLFQFSLPGKVMNFLQFPLDESFWQQTVGSNM